MKQTKRTIRIIQLDANEVGDLLAKALQIPPEDTKVELTTGFSDEVTGAILTYTTEEEDTD